MSTKKSQPWSEFQEILDGLTHDETLLFFQGYRNAIAFTVDGEYDRPEVSGRLKEVYDLGWKMASADRTKLVKSADAHRQHFKQRLSERFGMKITDEEYDAKCEILSNGGKNVKNPENGGIHGIRKSSNRVLYRMELRGRKMLVLFDNPTKSLSTVYPPECIESTEELLKAIFPRMLWNLAISVFRSISQDIEEKAKMHFDTNKEAAMYMVNHTPFVGLVMSIRNGNTIPPMKMAYTVKTIIEGDHNQARLVVDFTKGAHHNFKYYRITFPGLSRTIETNAGMKLVSDVVNSCADSTTVPGKIRMQGYHAKYIPVGIINKGDIHHVNEPKGTKDAIYE